MKSPAFQWYPTDYLGSQRVAMMTLEEEGAYCRLLWYCWQHGSIPSEPPLVARLIGKGCTELIAEAILPMFEVVLSDGRLSHDRLEQERTKQKHWRAKSSKGGKRSAEARKGGSTTLQPPLQPKGNTPSSVSVLQTSVSTENNGACLTVPVLLQELGGIYSRPLDQWPTDVEQRAALELLKRPKFSEEKLVVLEFSRRIAPEDRRFEFPKTLSRLLESWSETLDKARNYTPYANNGKPRQQGFDRNAGTANAGKSAQYAGVGKVGGIQPRSAQPVPPAT